MPSLSSLHFDNRFPTPSIEYHPHTILFHRATRERNRASSPRSIDFLRGKDSNGTVPSPLPQQGLTRRYLCLAALDPAFDDSRSGVNPPPSPLRLAIIGWLHSPLTLLPFPPRPQRGRRQEKRNRNLRNDLSRSRSSSVDRSNEKRTFVSFHSRDSMKGRERERHKFGAETDRCFSFRKFFLPNLFVFSNREKFERKRSGWLSSLYRARMMFLHRRGDGKKVYAPIYGGIIAAH